MPTTLNKEFQRIRPIPDGLLPNTEVFYLSSTNEVFLDYDDYFERMIQLNSSCWRCSVTGRTGLTYDEALQSETDAIKRRKKREETAKCKKATLSPTGASKAAAAEEAARKKRQIHEQQQQLEPLFRQAEKAGVEQMDRWRQSRRLLHEAHIGALREAIQAAKETERKRQLERQRREREALAEWRKPRDDLLCEDLKPFPDFKALCWPDWVPREHYWDILAISSFCHSFAPLLIMDDQRMPVSAAFSAPQIATALVSRQINENSRFYRLLDTLLNTLRECIIQDDGNAADLTNPDHVGNEALKDFDHPMHGERIRQINRECQRQFKLHGASVWELSRDYLDLSEVIRLLLLTAGFYTKFRRQMRGQMHCYEDDGFIFAQQHPELVEHLEKFSVYSLNPTQRVQLITTFMDQLLSHSRFRQLIDQRIDELAELRKRLKQLKAVDLQHDKEARDALQQHKDQQKAEEELVDKDEQKARAAVQRELALLRRAVAQLNEGRRIKDIGDLRERMLDAQRPLPWRAMADAREVHEFRSVQQNFYSDRKEELLHEMYQLQGKMGMFLLGRDRAFRSYYYMNTAFIILCPRRDELADGYCWGERTPKATTKAKATDSGTETEEEEEEEKQRSASRETEGQRQHNGCNKTEEGSREAEEGRKSAQSGGEEGEEEENELAAEDGRCSPPLAPLMACTGDGMEQCPVHNPPARWPRLLVYVERDGVRKLLDALNPRGFRESELAESISLYRDFYRQEMVSLFDSTDTLEMNWGAHLFGFGHGKPKELRETEPTELDLFVEVRRRLLDLEKLLHDRGLGSPHCSADREEWRTMLENSQDTSMLCQGNCIPFIRSSTPPATALGTMPMPSSDHGTVVGDGAVEHDQQQQMMYTREELSNPNLDSVQILGIALMQLVHGIRRDCFYNTFMMTIKKNNGTVLKRPTPSFMEWQKGLKACQSPSAVALFETTLEFAINWDFKAEDGTTVSQQQKAKSGGRRRQMPRDGSAKTDDENTENENNASTSAAMAQKQQQRQHTRQREVNNLLVEAGFLGGMAIGARTRKPVTKYGDVEMDVDKLNFDEEEEEEEDEQQQRREENAEEMEEEYKEEQSGDEQQQQPDELLEDEEEEEGHRYGRGGTDEEEEEEDSDGMEYPRGREASTRTRKPVTKYGAAGLDELLNSGGEEGENDERFLDDDNSND